MPEWESSQMHSVHKSPVRSLLPCCGLALYFLDGVFSKFFNFDEAELSFSILFLVL